MPDIAIVAARRHELLSRIAGILGCKDPVPPTKSDAVIREEHLALLIFLATKQLEALGLRLDGIEERIESLETALEVREEEDEPKDDGEDEVEEYEDEE